MIQDDTILEADPVEPPKPGRRARRLAIALGVIGLLALLGADAAWSAVSMVHSLHQARDELQGGADAFKAGDLKSAAALFDQAEEHARRAKSFAGHPSVLLGTLLPVLGDDVRAVRAVSAASVYASEAGAEVVRAAGAAGWTGTGLPGGEEGGKVDLGAVERAAPALEAAAADAERARRAIAGFSSESLIGPVRRPFETARSTLSEQSVALSSAATLAKLLPTLLGGDGERHYLLTFQNLSDARGSGGFMGSYGILDAKDGDITLGPIGSLSDLKKAPEVTGFPDVARRYGVFGGTTYYDSANYSPNFPTSARVLLQMWQGDGRRPLDGMIAVDPVWMSYVLKATGPVQAGELSITADNVDTVLLHDTFLTPSQPFSNFLQTAIGDAMFHALIDRPLPTHGLGDAMARAVRERHFQVFSLHPGEERSLERLDATGRLHLGRNPLFVVRDDELDNRTGWFAHPSVAYRIQLHDDGSADVSMTYAIRNEAPRHGPPSILIGWQPGKPQGVFATDVSTYLPAGARDIKTTVAHGPNVTTHDREFGHPVSMTYVRIPGGGDARIRLRYRVPHAAVEVGGALVYTAKLISQPKLWPVPVSVQVILPDGAGLHGAAAAFHVDGDVLRYQAPDVTTRALWVEYGS